MKITKSGWSTKIARLYQSEVGVDLMRGKY